MKRRTKVAPDGPSAEVPRSILRRPLRRGRPDDRREPAIDWLAADPVFQRRVAARV